MSCPQHVQFLSASKILPETFLGNVRRTGNRNHRRFESFARQWRALFAVSNNWSFQTCRNTCSADSLWRCGPLCHRNELWKVKIWDELFPQGSISPNFFRQATIRWRTAFGEKFAIQFHQPLPLKFSREYQAKIRTKFAKSMRNLPNLCAVRQTPFAKKSFSSCAREQMLMKSTPGGIWVPSLFRAFPIFFTAKPGPSGSKRFKFKIY